MTERVSSPQASDSARHFLTLLALAYPESDPFTRAVLASLMQLEAARQEVFVKHAASNPVDLQTATAATQKTLTHYEHAVAALDAASPFVMDCARGCDHCCRVQVAASVSEIVLLAEWLRANLDPDTLQNLTQLLGEMWAKIAGHTPQTRPAIPCPMLGREGECTVYEARPLACRGWVSSDVRRCIEARDNPPGLVEADPRRLMLSESLSHALRSGVKRILLDGRAVDLHGALWIALSEPGAVLRWLAGEDVFAPATL
jgi:hypothetical protein